MAIGVNTSGGAPSVYVELKGIKQFEEMLNKVDYKLQRKVMMRVVKDAVKPLVSAAKSKAPVNTGRKTYLSAHKHFSKGVFVTKLVKRRPGELKRSIGVYIPKNQMTVYVGPQRKRVEQVNNGWYGHFLEFGTKGFTVKQDRWIPLGDRQGLFLKAGARVPGQKAKPYMRPAWQHTKPLVLKNIETNMMNELKQVWK